MRARPDVPADVALALSLLFNALFWASLLGCVDLPATVMLALGTCSFGFVVGRAIHSGREGR